MNKCPNSILDCELFDNVDCRDKFRRDLQNKSGIYMLKYKHDDRIFYKGKSVDLSRRLGDHYNRSSLSSNRLGLFLRMVGWCNVSVHILEFCSELELDDRENHYIKKYLPSLNRKFSTSYSSKVNLR